MARVLVIGGYGTFGGEVSRELVRRGVSITVAGRDQDRAERFAKELSGDSNAAAVDVQDAAACEQALSGHGVAVQCAGPFARFDDTLLQACLRRRVHYVDLADDRDYVAQVRRLGEEFSQRQLTAAFGCSSLPAISGAAALRALAHATAEVRHVRVTLFIGNRNPKGRAAVESASRLLGATISAGGILRKAFAEPEIVPLPAPFGCRAARNFDSPDYDLLPGLLRGSVGTESQPMNTPSVVVKVGCEWELTNRLFALFTHCAPRLGKWLLPRLAVLGSRWMRFGSSGGAVMAELFLSDGSVSRCAVVAHERGQRMAALPAVYLAERLASGETCPLGAVTAYEVLGDERLLELLAADGCEVVTTDTRHRN